MTNEQVEQATGIAIYEVVLDWYCKRGRAWLVDNVLYKSPADATPHELATCRRQNEPAK